VRAAPPWPTLPLIVLSAGRPWGPQIPLMIAEGKLPADFEEALTNVARHQDDQYLFLRYRCKLPFKLRNALTIESSDVWQ
jgi:hypothetical protein